MTDRAAPDQPLPDGTAAGIDDDLLLAYVDGTLAAPRRAELDARLAGDPALRAELEGLQAVRTLLDRDAQFGLDSRVDVPPAHLLDAIVRAEVLARPDEIRQAVALARSAPTPSDKPLWARMQSWWMGGGVVVGAAAAVVFVVSRPAEPPVLQSAAAPAAVVEATPPPRQPPTLADGDGDEKVGDDLAGNPAGGLGGLAAAAPVEATPDAQARRDGAKELAKADARGALDDDNRGLDRGDAGGAQNAPLDALALNTAAADPAPNADAARAERKREAPKAALEEERAPAPAKKPAPRAADDAADGADNGAPHDAADDAFAAPAPAAEPAAPAATTTAPSASGPMPVTASPPPPPPTSVGSGGYRSADEAASAFREKLRAKKSAQIDREGALQKKQGKGSTGADKNGGDVAEQSKSKAKDAPARAPGADSSTSRGAERALTPTEAREEIERQKRLDNASMLLTTAERELAAGRAQSALDLAVRAEASAGSALGLVPAATQTRAHLQLRRYADAARVGSRLLQGDVADPVIVDGLLAGADAATAVGDRRLADRMLQKALQPANKDKVRRAQAQKRLDALRAADVRNRAASESDAAEAPAAASKSAAPATDDE